MSTPSSMQVKDMAQCVMVIGEEVVTLNVVGRSSLAKVVEGLSRSTSTQELFIAGAFQLPGGTPVDIVIQGGMFYYLWRPPVIPISCTVTTDMNGLLVPHLGPEDPNANAMMTLDWKPPIPHLYLMLPTYKEKRWFLGELYMFALHEGQVYRPPLPNCFADGRICHNTKGGPGFATVVECLLYVESHMRDSIWNADLRQNATQKWVQFKPKGRGTEQVFDSTLLTDTGTKLSAFSNSIINPIAELWTQSNAT